MNRGQQMKTRNLLSLLFAIIATDATALSLLKPVAFPASKSDTTFVDRMEAKSDGYAPYAGTSAYKTMAIESEEAYLTRLVSRAEAQRQSDQATMSDAQYCDKYPTDDKKCPQTPGLTESLVAIGNDSSTPTPAQPTRPATTMPTQPTEPASPSAPSAPAVAGNIVGYSMSGAPVVASVRIHDGPCTPPQRSKNFVNQILTSGQYESRDSAFEKAMITTFRTEGGCGNHPSDSGGYTCYGISQNNNPEVDVRNITRADAENIAFRKYYTAHGLDRLPDQIRGDVFMFGWAAGPVTGIRHLCRVLGLPERNKIDDEIVHAVENYPGDLHRDYMDDQQQYMIDVSRRGNNKVFLKGWMNRIRLIRDNGCHTPTTEPLSR